MTDTGGPDSEPIRDRPGVHMATGINVCACSPFNFDSAGHSRPVCTPRRRLVYELPAMRRPSQGRRIAFERLRTSDRLFSHGHRDSRDGLSQDFRRVIADAVAGLSWS